MDNPLFRYLHAILDQNYSGNITIFPSQLSLNDVLSILCDMSEEFIQIGLLKGERDTWPGKVNGVQIIYKQFAS